MARSASGMVPSVYYAMQALSLAIYGDGLVLTAVTPTVVQLVPTRYELARIDATAVQSFVTTTPWSGLLSGATGFGTPRVTDLATTTVTVRGDTGQAEVRGTPSPSRSRPR